MAPTKYFLKTFTINEPNIYKTFTLGPVIKYFQAFDYI